MNAKVSDLIKLDSTFIVCLTVILLASIGGFGYYSVTDRILMAGNINEAISKGIDPLSVRCSYAKSDDLICVAFASSASYAQPTQRHNVVPQAKK